MHKYAFFKIFLKLTELPLVSKLSAQKRIRHHDLNKNYYNNVLRPHL